MKCGNFRDEINIYIYIYIYNVYKNIVSQIFYFILFRECSGSHQNVGKSGEELK